MLEELLERIDAATEPAKMSKENALELLERLIDDLRSRCEALRDEIKEP